jgi:hypothetical protein
MAFMVCLYNHKVILLFAPVNLFRIDVSSRQGGLVRAFRKQIVLHAANSAEGRSIFTKWGWVTGS